MIGAIIKTFVLFSIMFASSEAAGGSLTIEQLYTQGLQPKYQNLHTLKEQAQERKKAIIISSVVAVVTFFLFAYFFKLLGVIISLIMIAAGTWVLWPTLKNADGYETRFKKEILSPLMQNAAGYGYMPEKFSQETLANSHLFAAPIKTFSAGDMYGKEGVKFSFVHVVFNTKENASVERMAQNVFDGYIIMIDKKNPTLGVLVSEALRDVVADTNIPMRSFFANAKRTGSRSGFDIYGDVPMDTIDKISALKDQKIALSFTKEKIFIALYKANNPFDIDLLGDFDVSKAKVYDRAAHEIETLVHTLL